MYISDLLRLFVDPDSQYIRIYDLENEEEIYYGDYENYDGDDYEIQSIDNLDYYEGNELFINI